MTPRELAFRQDLAANDASRPATISPGRSLRQLLLDRQHDEGFWTDEWASREGVMGRVGITSLACLALLESPSDSSFPALLRALDWLWSCTVTPQADASDPPESESLLALMAFLKADCIGSIGGGTVVAGAVQRLRDIQNKDGGWHLADGNAPAGAMSQPESTGNVLTVLGMCRIGCDDRTVRQALRYLERVQECDSGWGGFAATASVLGGLRSVGMNREWPPICRAIEWIKRSQHPDGGWGSLMATAHAIRALSPEAPSHTTAGRTWLHAQLPDGSALLPLITTMRAGGLDPIAIACQPPLATLIPSTE